MFQCFLHLKIPNHSISAPQKLPSSEYTWNSPAQLSQSRIKELCLLPAVSRGFSSGFALSCVHNISVRYYKIRAQPEVGGHFRARVGSRAKLFTNPVEQ
ncbi:hypothetical protein BJX68DRAFT_128450 [Aspergillus pseudodeflectus]|uniref:Uncharacterized protein n=1 Tax=Aspergillus pseudodeflectus TaxID=176178 RepID=A0ABR4K427_9EURO